MSTFNKNISAMAAALALLACGTASAQNNPDDKKPFSTGLLFDKEAYKKIPQKAVMMTRDYTSLPASASLKKYCPTPASQGAYGTCVGWSSAYAARSIVEARQKGTTDKATIDQNTFSPGFVYGLNRFDDDYNCGMGTYIDKALETMKYKGVPLMKDFASQCVTSGEVSQAVFQKAKNYKIKDYVTLFDETSSAAYKTQMMKKALAENNPVVIGMGVPTSFNYPIGEFWKPTESPTGNYGGHAMCVIGYDDAKGAFEIMNSWGTEWGNGGFIWVKYADFANFVHYAYEMIPMDAPKPANQTDLAGGIELKMDNNSPMPAKAVADRGFEVVSNVSYSNYKLNNAYKSGDKYRIYVSNNEPAYVYVIGSDLSQKTVKIFPNAAGISPALTYKSNNIAIPDERYFIQFDNTKGTDYLCVLYSRKSLDIDGIIRSMAGISGNFSQKVSKALGADLVSPGDIKYSPDKIQFTATSKGKSVVPIIVEVQHQ